MNEPLQIETEKLARSWMRHDQEFLGQYLVAGVEDPRLNIQSILTRQFLITALSGSRFDRLLEQELRFALVLNWLRQVSSHIATPDDLEAIRHALRQRVDNAEGLPIPHYATTAFAALPQMVDDMSIPNYLDQILSQNLSADHEFVLPEPTLATFQEIWRQILEAQPPSGRSVLEPACGSANDYRFLDRFGLSHLLDYTGFDLCEKNILNAREFHPRGRFSVGNVFAIPAPDLGYDYCIVHDLFEHLSLEGMERALDEVCRVTRLGFCLGFFNLHEGPEHFVRPVDEYHWNKLSLPRLRRGLEERGFAMEAIHIDTFLRWRFGCADTHNKNAYSLLGTRVESRMS